MSRLESIMSPERDYTPRSNANSLKDFMEGVIYEDFLNEIKVRIETMRDYNEECDSKSYLETRGGIKALRLVSGIFNDLYNNADLTKKVEEK